MVLGLSTWTLVGGILLIASIMALFFRSKLAQSLFSVIPIGNMRTKVLAAGIIGLILGGIAIFPALWVAGAGLVKTGTTTDLFDSGAKVTPGVMLTCEYRAGSSADGNVTVRTDTSRTDLVNLDVDESTGCGDETAGTYALINITCSRSGSVGTGNEVAVLLVAKSDDFLSEVSTSSANEYNFLEKKSTASTVWAGEYQSEVYFASTASTSASNIEKGYLTFAAGTKEASESITLEIDKESCLQLNNYTTKYVTIYQRDNGVDRTIFTIPIQKVP